MSHKCAQFEKEAQRARCSSHGPAIDQIDVIDGEFVALSVCSDWRTIMNFCPFCGEKSPAYKDANAGTTIADAARDADAKDQFVARVAELKRLCEAAIEDHGARARFDQIEVEIDPDWFAKEVVSVVREWLQLHKTDAAGNPDRWQVVLQTGLGKNSYLRFWKKQ